MAALKTYLLLPNVPVSRTKAPFAAADAALQLGERTLTPASRAVNLEESRSCFMSSLNEYAANKVRGHYGDHLRRSTNSLASLAGY